MEGFCFFFLLSLFALASIARSCARLFSSCRDKIACFCASEACKFLGNSAPQYIQRVDKLCKTLCWHLGHWGFVSLIS